MRDSKQRVLVDTSSFIDYFRYAKGDSIPALALSDSIVLSKVVRLELIKGAKRADRKVLLNFLDGLIHLEDFPSAQAAEAVLLKLHGRGFNLGFADLLILADTVESKSMLLTSDKALASAAKTMGIKMLKV